MARPTGARSGTVVAQVGPSASTASPLPRLHSHINHIGLAAEVAACVRSSSPIRSPPDPLLSTVGFAPLRQGHHRIPYWPRSSARMAISHIGSACGLTTPSGTT